MERKLWFKIFALLLLLALSALASHDNETSSLSTVAPETGPSSALAPVTPTAGPESESSLDGQVHGSNENTETSPSSPLNSTTKEGPAPLVPLDTSTGTTVTNSSESLYINGTVAENATSVPASENQTSATQSQLTTTSTTLSSSNKTETLPVPPPTSPSHLGFTNTSQTDAFIDVAANTPTTKVTLSTTTPATTSTTTTIATSTTTTSSSSTAQEIRATTHHRAITPSQLNVGEDTTAVHEAPTLDPLLAGLVSAFIIAAVIITLLLFLKLRRRDTRPEFRRLQDLPMDDMMEDTPLSMYSY